MRMLPREVFLSHSTENRAIAEQIADSLRRHGVPIFYAPENILGAQQWQNEILAALNRCDWFLVLVSRAAVQSMWVNRETAYALAEPRFNNRIVPLLLEECDLGNLAWLKILQMIDFRAEPQDACRRLLQVWGVGMKS
jgi:hypothetical protein